MKSRATALADWAHRDLGRELEQFKALYEPAIRDIARDMALQKALYEPALRDIAAQTEALKTYFDQTLDADRLRQEIRSAMSVVSSFKQLESTTSDFSGLIPDDYLQQSRELSQAMAQALTSPYEGFDQFRLERERWLGPFLSATTPPDYLTDVFAELTRQNATQAEHIRLAMEVFEEQGTLLAGQDASSFIQQFARDLLEIKRAPSPEARAGKIEQTGSSLLAAAKAAPRSAVSWFEALNLVLTLLFFAYQLIDAEQDKAEVLRAIAEVEKRALVALGEARPSLQAQRLHALKRPLVLRQEPRPRARSLLRLDTGQVIEIIDGDDRWLHVFVFDQAAGRPIEGWIRAGYSRPLMQEAPTRKRVRVRIRQRGPAAFYFVAGDGDLQIED